MELTKIMYAEDEPDIQAVARVALEMVGGFQVSIVNSGLDLLEQVTGYAPDLIMLDVMMPGMDGPSTLQALKNIPELASIPVVFMTAKVQPAEVQQYKAMGAVDVIPKPFDPMNLANQLRDVWGRLHG